MAAQPPSALVPITHAPLSPPVELLFQHAASRRNTRHYCEIIPAIDQPKNSNQSQIATAENTSEPLFLSFPELPPELRTKIWKEHIGDVKKTLYGNSKDPKIVELAWGRDGFTSPSKEVAGSLLAVSKEYKAEALGLSDGFIELDLTFGKTCKDLGTESKATGSNKKNIVFHPDGDILYIRNQDTAEKNNPRGLAQELDRLLTDGNAKDRIKCVAVDLDVIIEILTVLGECKSLELVFAVSNAKIPFTPSTNYSFRLLQRIPFHFNGSSEAHFMPSYTQFRVYGSRNLREFGTSIVLSACYQKKWLEGLAKTPGSVVPRFEFVRKLWKCTKEEYFKFTGSY